MPQQPEKPKQSNIKTGPSPSLWAKLTGGAMSKSMDDWPAAQTAWANEQIRQPNITNAVGTVRPMNWYERKFAAPGADAIQWPWGTIAMNRQNIEANKSDVGDVLVHELKHVEQGPSLMRYLRNTIGGKDYLARPEEQEAFQAEAERNVRRGDIQLPGPKTPPLVR